MKVTAFFTSLSAALTTLVSAVPSYGPYSVSGLDQTPLPAVSEPGSEMVFRVHPAGAIWKKCVDVAGGTRQNGVPLLM